MRREARPRHGFIRTEEACVDWARCFCSIVIPALLGDGERQRVQQVLAAHGDDDLGLARRLGTNEGLQRPAA